MHGPIIAVGMILTQALFGAGNSRYVMLVELFLHFTCLVPLAYAWESRSTAGYRVSGRGGGLRGSFGDGHGRQICQRDWQKIKL